MKLTYVILAISMFTDFAFGQAKPISQQEYDKAFDFAISETNSRYPFVHTFTSEFFENGKIVRNSIHVAERKGDGLERQTFTDVIKGKTTTSYQLRTGFGDNVYCSTDGKLWTGPQKYECPRPLSIFGARTPPSVIYSVEAKIISGKKVNEYRKFEAYEMDFDEDVSLIDANGLFISTTQTMGDLKLKQINTKLTNSWKFNAKFPPIKIPKNLAKK